MTTGGGGDFVVLAGGGGGAVGGAAVDFLGRSIETISSFEPACAGSVGGRYVGPCVDGMLW